MLILLGLPPGLCTQETPPEVSYEGQKVALVDLVAHPEIDVESLRQLIQLAPGEAYSTAKAQATVDALSRTGRFHKVTFDVEPEAAGLRVTFSVQPIFYIGLISFPGATKVFKYPRLLQAVGLPDEEPYEESRIAEAENSLLEFLRSEGFFQARRQTETQFDEAHQLANPIFHVTLNQRARLGRVEVTGPPPAESARLEQALHSYRAMLHSATLKRGKPYTAHRLEAATRFLHDYLAKRNRPAHQIKLSTRYHPEINRADLSFSITEGPLISIRVVGARLSRIPFNEKRPLRRLIPVYEEGAFDRDLVLEGKRNLINFFQSKGYFDVKVDDETRETPASVDLVYHIAKGKRRRLESVAFSGNAHFPEVELRRHISIAKGRWFSHGHFSEKLMKSSAENLAIFYRDAGFEKVEVQPKVVDRGSTTDVTFQIAEGPQTIVEGLRVEGNQTLPQLASVVKLNLRAGQPFSPAGLRKDRDQILAAYLERGYLSARASAEVQQRPGGTPAVAVLYRIDEGPQVRIQDVVLMGQQRTKEAFIDRVADLHSVDLLTQTRLLASESRLYNLEIFDWASVGLRRPVTNQDQEVAVVKVHEAQRNTITFGLGFELARRPGSVPSGTVVLPGLPPIGLGLKTVTSEKAFASPKGTIEYMRRNLRGRAETASISARLARLDQRGLTTYANPHFRGSNWSSLFSLSGERTSENPIFTARLGEASFQVEKSLDASRTKILQLRYGFRRTVLSKLLFPQLVAPEDRAVRLSSISASYIRDTRDKPLDAHRGIYQTFDMGLTPKAFGSSANFARFLGQTAYYRQVGGSVVWANSLRLGLAKAFAGSVIPLSERFFSGGATSLRGFPIDGAGPQRSVPVCSDPANPSTCETIRVPVGGNQLFVLNSELRFPLPLKKGLGGVLFYDGGNVYDRISIVRFVRNYTSAVGFGLRYGTPLGPIRLDLARNLNPVTGIKRTQYFITLGQAF